MYKKILIPILLLFANLSGEEYWQQFVQYKMNVRLDTSANTIGGQSIITYKNNSPDTLYHFYLNLYANAFQ